MNQTGDGGPEEQVTQPSAAESSRSGSDDPRVIAALEEYVSAMKAGQTPLREAFLARYPEIAPALGECLEGLACIRGAAPSAVRALTPHWQSPGGTAPAANVEPGTLLGDYHIVREVGRGGMGVVYEAVQLSLGRPVALKVLPFAASMDGKQLQRFKNEAQAAAHLRHTNIVPVFGTGCEHGVHFFAMQLIGGQTLATLIDGLRQIDECRSSNAERRTNAEIRSTHASPHNPAKDTEPVRHSTFGILSSFDIRHSSFFRTVAHLGVQAAAALEHAHQVGIVHRDIKPSNLLVESAVTPGKRAFECEGLRLWVTDFGLAHMQNQVGHTMTGDLVGTLRYMSPEQALGKRALVDQRTDIYSLGVTLFELLTLEPAFPGTDREELLRQIAFEEPRRPRRLNQAIPVDLETIVLKATAKNPEERYATAQELADDLERFLIDQPIRARRATRAQRVRKWARRHRAAVWAASLSLLGVVLVLAGSIGWVARDQAARREEGDRRAGEALQAAGQLVPEEKWAEALGFVGHAEVVLAHSSGSADLLAEASVLRQALETALKLEQARLKTTADRGGKFDWQTGNAAYAEAFARHELDVDGLDLQEAAGRILASPIRQQLITALDDWAWMRKTLKVDGWQRRLALARLVDPDPWRNRLRDALAGKDERALAEVIESASPDKAPLATLMLLGKVTQGTAQAARAATLLRHAQQQHPNDFWINHQLGDIYYNLDWSHLEEAVYYYGIAVALRPESLGARYNLGIALAKQNKFDEAIVEFNKAIALDRNYAWAHSNLGSALYRKGNLDQAVAELRKGLALGDRTARTHFDLSVALDRLGKSDESIAEFHKGIRINPNDAQAYYHLGNTYWAHRKVDEAITQYRKAIALDPDLAPAHCNLGVALAKQDKLDEAIAAYNKAIALDPKNLPAHTSLAIALARQNKLDAALATCRKAIAVDPKDASAHNTLGAILCDYKRDYAGAIAACREAVRLNKDLADAHRNLGVALAYHAQLKEAIVEWRQAIALDPNDTRAHVNLGIGLAQLNRLDEAIAAYRKAITLDPNDAQTHNSLGALLCDKKRDYAGAAAAFREAIRLNKDFAGAYINLGNALAHQKKYGEAIVQWQQAIQLDPKNALAHDSLRYYLARSGRVAEAIPFYTRELARRPTSAALWTARGNCHVMVPDHARALADYAKVVELEPGNAQAWNRVAWMLVTCPDIKLRDAGRATAMARKAVALAPTDGNCWLTLGWAGYRAGDWKAAQEAAEKALSLRKGGDGADWFLLAMIHWELGDKEKARRWYDKAAQWMSNNPAPKVELRCFQTEAAELLGIQRVTEMGG
jgi:tetratricopeptide (TPR) repeat protein